MPSSTPDWSALASQNEKLVNGSAARETADPDPAAQPSAAPSPAGHPTAGPSPAAQPARRRAVAAAAAAALGLTGVASATTAASAQTAASPSWQIVKQVHGGVQPDFTAVVAVGKTGGWAFDQGSTPTAWKRSGSTWTRVAFPGKKNESVVAAGESSATNVWAFTDGSGTPSRALRWNGHGWAAERSFSGQIGGAVVLSRDDVWVFGEPIFPGTGLGSWHYNGHTWSHVSSGHGLQGGSGLSASSIWAFGGTSVAHWNGHTWKRTSVKGLLPARTQLNSPSVTAIYAESASSVWAIGNGNDEDDGGPLVILHDNGHGWSRAPLGGPTGEFAGSGVLGQVASDGHGGLWIPMPGPEGGPSALLHYSGGHLSTPKLPGGASKIDVESIAAIPGTTGALAGGFTHKAGNLGVDVVGVILQYKS
jgi:hypothetical protein